MSAAFRRRQMCVFLCLPSSCCSRSQEECEGFCTIMPDSVCVPRVWLLLINSLLPRYFTFVPGCLCVAQRRVSETEFSSKNETQKNEITSLSLPGDKKKQTFMYYGVVLSDVTTWRGLCDSLWTLSKLLPPWKILISRHGSSKLSQSLSTVVTFNYSFDACHHRSLFRGSRHASSDWMGEHGQDSRNETATMCDRDRGDAAARQRFLILHTSAVAQQIWDCGCACVWVCVILFQKTQ